VLLVINAAFFPAAFFAHWWIFDASGHGIPTDFINVWSAGKLAQDGHPALAYDWNIQKSSRSRCSAKITTATSLALSAAVSVHREPAALLPYAVAYIGWAAASFVPYLFTMRAIVGRPFGLALAAAFPAVLTNTLVGQNVFLTASLIGARWFFCRRGRAVGSVSGY